MITSITHIDPDENDRKEHRFSPPLTGTCGFTLVEILVGLSLGTMVMAGVLSACLMIGRTGANAVNYSAAETELRRALEEFSQDVRMAKSIKWNSAASITLTLPGSPDTVVTYVWDSAASGATARSFYRKAGDAASTAAATVFVRDVSNLSFLRFNRQNGSATTDAATKRVQITIEVTRKSSTVVAATTRMVTASYTLRNKVIN